MKDALVRNVADRHQVKAAQKEEEKIRQLQIDDMFFLLSTPQGRRVLWRYLGLCGIYRLSYTGSADTNFREGERNIGLQLMSDIMEANADAYLQMINENKKEKSR